MLILISLDTTDRPAFHIKSILHQGSQCAVKDKIWLKESIQMYSSMLCGGGGAIFMPCKMCVLTHFWKKYERFYVIFISGIYNLYNFNFRFENKHQNFSLLTVLFRLKNRDKLVSWNTPADRQTSSVSQHGLVPDCLPVNR